MMTAMAAGKGIIGNLPLAEEAHFRFLEQNPAAAAMLSNYAKSSASTMLKTIPIGREAEYVEMVRRAFKALQLPESSAELVSFIEMYDVGHQPQIKPRNTVVNFTPDNSKSVVASRIVVTSVILLLVGLPTLLFIFDDKPGVAFVIFIVVSFLILRGIIKKYKEIPHKASPTNLPPSRTIKDMESERAPEVSTRTQHIPKAEMGRQVRIAEPVRNIAEESARPEKNERYDRRDDPRRYRK